MFENCSFFRSATISLLHVHTHTHAEHLKRKHAHICFLLWCLNETNTSNIYVVTPACVCACPLTSHCLLCTLTPLHCWLFKSFLQHISPSVVSILPTPCLLPPKCSPVLFTECWEVVESKKNEHFYLLHVLSWVCIRTVTPCFFLPFPVFVASQLLDLVEEKACTVPK